MAGWIENVRERERGRREEHGRKIISPSEREVEGWRERESEEKVEVPAQKIRCASTREIDNREE